MAGVVDECHGDERHDARGAEGLGAGPLAVRCQWAIADYDREQQAKRMTIEASPAIQIRVDQDKLMDGIMKKIGYIRKLPVRTPAVEYASATELGAAVHRDRIILHYERHRALHAPLPSLVSVSTIPRTIADYLSGTSQASAPTPAARPRLQVNEPTRLSSATTGDGTMLAFHW